MKIYKSIYCKLYVIFISYILFFVITGCGGSGSDDVEDKLPQATIEITDSNLLYQNNENQASNGFRAYVNFKSNYNTFNKNQITDVKLKNGKGDEINLENIIYSEMNYLKGGLALNKYVGYVNQYHEYKYEIYPNRNIDFLSDTYSVYLILNDGRIVSDWFLSGGKLLSGGSGIIDFIKSTTMTYVNLDDGIKFNWYNQTENFKKFIIMDGNDNIIFEILLDKTINELIINTNIIAKIKALNNTTSAGWVIATYENDPKGNFVNHSVGFSNKVLITGTSL